MKKKQLFQVIFRPLYFFPAYLISLLIPRNKKIWVYGSFGGGFIDNSKHLFLYANRHIAEIKHIWISPSKDVVEKLRALGFLAYYKYSLKAFYYALTAKVYIYSGGPSDIIHGCFRGKAFLFNLWHGVPYKRIEYDIKKGIHQPFFNPKNLFEKLISFLQEPKIFRDSSAVLTPSEELVNIFSSAFKKKRENILVSQYPRNEILKLSTTEIHNHINKYESTEFKDTVAKFGLYNKVIIYMPTWRGSNPGFMSEALKNLEQLDLVCRKHNILFVIKSHIYAVFSDDLTKYSNIKKLDNQMDIYPLLPFSTSLITDYSSIAFDYSLLHKQILFYPFDLEQYLSKDTETYFNYETVFSNNYVSNFEELLQALELIGLETGSQKFFYPQCYKYVNSSNELLDIFKFIKKEINFGYN